MTTEVRPVFVSRAKTQLVCHPFSKLTARTHGLARQWLRNTAGASAIEFALLAPLVAIMFVGVVEVGQAIAVNRRVSQIASATGDLVARADTKISQSDISDIMKVGGYTMEPYNQAPLQINLSNVTSSPTDATNTKQSWICIYKATGGTTTCTCTNTAQPIPPNLVSTNDSIVKAQVMYAYKPLIFDHFMKASWGSAGNGTYTFARTLYFKPRGQAAMLLQSNNTPCPSITFP